MKPERLVLLLVVAAFVGTLEVLAQYRFVSPLTLAPPSRMATTLWQLLVSGAITGQIVRTFSLVAAAVGLSLVVGFALGVILHAAPRARHALEPFFASYYAVPIFVFYPILVILFGLNAWPLIIIGAMFGTVAVIIATLTALDRVPTVFLKTAAVMRLSPSRTLWTVRLPAMAPHLMAGVKLAVAYGFIGVIGAEFILASSGLGHSIAFAYNNFDTPRMYALMLLVVVVAIAINMSLHTLEKTLRRRAR